jgi:hypothetical protein
VQYEIRHHYFLGLLDKLRLALILAAVDLLLLRRFAPLKGLHFSEQFSCGLFVVALLSHLLVLY